MVLPITGPFTSSIQTPVGAPVRSYSDTTTRWRQKAPFTEPLPYQRDTERVLLPGPNPSIGSVNSTGDSLQRNVPLTRPAYFNEYFSKTNTFALKLAKDRFKSMMRPDQAQLLNLYLERKQAMGTLATRGTQLAAYFWLLKKDPLRAFSYVIPPHDKAGWRRTRKLIQSQDWKKFKKGSRQFSDVYLETMFGVIPTISDISAAVNVLGGEVPPCKIVEKGKYKRLVITGREPTGQYDYTMKSFHQLTSKGTVGAEISVSNPNLFLANQLGLINLAATVWEAAPWSFVVDYFTDVSGWLDQFTETWGLSVLRPYYVVTCIDTVTTHHLRTTKVVTPYVWGISSSVGMSTKRTLGSLPFIPLKVNKPWTLSVRRASTSISLLLQRLPR